MRPHDVPILIKMALEESRDLRHKDIAYELFISASEVSDSLNRSRAAGLVNQGKSKVNRQSLMEFLEHGFKYVFPPQLGTITTGVPTSTGHEFMREKFSPGEVYVWPEFHGEYRGIALEPLYKNQLDAIRRDPRLYKVLALLDVVRMEKVREVKVAVAELKKEILYG